MKSKYIEISNLVQVIGCIFKNPKLLEKDDKYSFLEEDFYDNFHKTVFGAMYNLWQLGNKEFTLVSIEDYLKQRPKAYGVYQANKGAEFLLRAAEMANLDTFNYYYNRMKKMTLLRAYEDMGMNLDWLYDPDNLLDLKKKQLQEDWLDNSTLLDIHSRINDKIDAIKTDYIHNLKEGVQIAEGVEDLLEEYKKTPALGYPLYGDFINTVTRGARLGKFFLRSAATGVGKAIPNYTLIPTPTGFRRVDEIEVGDYLFGQNGKPTKVLAVYPQPEKKKIWKMHFSSGRVAECCGEHLWEYSHPVSKGRKTSVRTTEEIKKHGENNKCGFKYAANNGYWARVKTAGAVEFEKKEYDLPPYLMGILLGFETWHYNNSRVKHLEHKKDLELISIIGAKFLNNLRTIKIDHTYEYVKSADLYYPKWFMDLFKNYSDIWQSYRGNRRIPQEYMIGSIDQRMELLRGLLDTSGSLQRENKIPVFNTFSRELSRDFLKLANSLGFVTTLINRRETSPQSTQYNVSIYCQNKVKKDLFNVKKCKDAAAALENVPDKRNFKEYDYITEVEETDEYADMTCFTVDAEDHLFLMNDYIVTHNTRAMIADITSIGCSEIYDKETQTWVGCGEPQSCLFIATEQDLQECQSMCIAFISGVDEEHLLTGEYEEGEWERVLKAVGVLKKSSIMFECLPDFSMSDIENVIKKHIRENKVQYIGFDYIHSSAKILTEIGGSSGVKNLREDNILFLLSSKLKDICVQYGVFILSSTQLNSMYQESETPDQNLLRG